MSQEYQSVGLFVKQNRKTIPRFTQTPHKWNRISAESLAVESIRLIAQKISAAGKKSGVPLETGGLEKKPPRTLQPSVA
jgi:hypothetical protein